MDGFSENCSLDSTSLCCCMSPAHVMKEFTWGLVRCRWANGACFLEKWSSTPKGLDTCWPVPTQYSKIQTYGFVMCGVTLLSALTHWQSWKTWDVSVSIHWKHWKTCRVSRNMSKQRKPSSALCQAVLWQLYCMMLIPWKKWLSNLLVVASFCVPRHHREELLQFYNDRRRTSTEVLCTFSCKKPFVWNYLQLPLQSRDFFEFSLIISASKGPCVCANGPFCPSVQQIS